MIRETFGTIAKAMLVGTAALTLGACGSESISDVQSSSSQHGEDEAHADDADMAMPPQGYYDAVLARNLSLAETGEITAALQKPVLFLNFDGAVVKKGFAKEESFIPCQASVTVPASGFSPTQKSEIMKLVAKYYDQAGVLLAVTSKKPASGLYTTMHIGGSYSLLGCGSKNNVLGLAPMDAGNKNIADVGFAFVNTSHSVFVAATTIAHEAGHSYGLNHVGQRSCVMYPTIVNEMQGFQSVATQDSPSLLKKALGVGRTTVEDSATPNPDNSADIKPDPAAPPKNPIPVIPNLPGANLLNSLSQIISGINPNSTGDLSKLIAAISMFIPGASGTLNSLNLMLAALQILSQQNPNLNLNSINNGTIPDLSALLGMAQSNNAIDLMKSLSNYKSFINANYSGTTQQALLSLAKVAYAQAFVKGLTK